jgi:four helix bundle protein
MKKRNHSTFNIQHSTTQETAATVWEFNDGAPDSRKFDLEDRLLESASAIIDLSESLPPTRTGNHIAGQVLRSGTSPLPNHGEAETAESREDFVHKPKICLKELRETRRWARLIKRQAWVKNETTLSFVLGESEELIRIFHSSIQTAKRNLQAETRKPSTSIRYPAGNAG